MTNDSLALADPMNISEQKKALAVAVEAARGAGSLMRRNFNSIKKVNFASQNDIKLDLDVRCQKLIQTKLLKKYPKMGILGEEGILGNVESEYRWVIDPIDGTVNFAYRIPHACVSVALQRNGQSIVGVVYDPFQDELWTAIRGQAARLNGEKIQVGSHSRLDQCVVAIGFAKEGKNLKTNLKLVETLVPKIRKLRIMGSAALALTYVASGRFDGYMEMGVHLWDVAAGSLIVECAGGHYQEKPYEPDYARKMMACSSVIKQKLERIAHL